MAEHLGGSSCEGPQPLAVRQSANGSGLLGLRRPAARHRAGGPQTADVRTPSAPATGTTDVLLGDTDGNRDGESLGAALGKTEGNLDGDSLGAALGCTDGSLDGGSLKSRAHGDGRQTRWRITGSKSLGTQTVTLMANHWEQ